MATSDSEKFREAMNDSKKSIASMLEKQKELEKGMAGYVKAYQDIAILQKEITQQEANKIELIRLNAIEEEKEGKVREALLDKEEKKGVELTRREKEKLKVLIMQKKARGESVKSLEKEIRNLERGVEATQEIVNSSSKLKAIARTTGSFVKKWGFDKLKTLGVFEIDKEIRNAARSMGLGAKASESFSKNLQLAGERTAYMGISTKELARMQKGYTEEIGRGVMLTEDGLHAMAAMDRGTGIDGFGVSMAGAMDNFGASVETTRDLVKETVDYAHDIGVNSAKAAEMTSKSLKLAQTFKFKGGAKGLAKMAADSLRLNINMESMAGIAEKVFRPEGAIEMAAQLGTMGGAFARLADPMQLMFKARNDMAGFQKDMAKASAEFVTFNKEQGQFEVKGGLALDRMREIGKMTGQSVEELQKMAKAQKKIETIGSVTPISFNEDDDILVSSLAEIQKGGGIEIMVDGLTKQVQDLTKHDLKMLREKNASLEEAAEQARTAEDTLNDIKTSFIQLLIPVAEALKKDFADPLKALVKNKEFKKTIRNLVSGIANLVGTVTKFIIQNPIKSIIGAIAGIGLFKAAMWFANGIALGTGFNVIASAMSPGSMLGNMGKMAVTVFSSAAAAATAGVAAAAVAGYSEYTENDEMGMSGSENAGRTTAKAAGAGLGAWGGATLGASIGLAGGPAAPVTVPLGFIVGGILGGLGGAAVGEAAGDGIYGDEKRNSPSKRGNTIATQDAMVEFHPDDNFGVLLASTSKNQLNKSAQTLTGNGGGSNSGGDGKIHHSHDKVNVHITLDGKGLDGNIGKALIADPEFVRGLSPQIQRATESVWKGGKNTS